MGRKLLTEFIGTFFLVMGVGLAGDLANGIGPLAIGLILMAMVYMGGHVSGAHYNPAVSFAILLRGKMTIGEFVAYVMAQIAGAFGGAAAVYWTSYKTFNPQVNVAISPQMAAVTEALFTFALAIVVLNVATSKKTAGNSYYGLAIGMTIAAAAFAGGPFSGGAFNPAVGIAPTLVKDSLSEASFPVNWVHVVGPLIGGGLAAIVFRFQNPEDMIDAPGEA
ncbi:MAG: MIP/aquaporin family protein [Fimbriimonadaceae bacterium]